MAAKLPLVRRRDTDLESLLCFVRAVCKSLRKHRARPLVLLRRQSRCVESVRRFLQLRHQSRQTQMRAD